MKKLVAVAVESDQHGTFYHKPVIISDYLSAVQYQKTIDSDPYELYVEFITYPDGTDLEQIVEDILNYETLPNEWIDWLDLEETLKFFEFEHATYSDGSIAYVGDKVVVDSDEFSWGFLKKSDIIGTVTLLDDPYFIQFSLDTSNIKSEVRLAHYLVRKLNED